MGGWLFGEKIKKRERKREKKELKQTHIKIKLILFPCDHSRRSQILHRSLMSRRFRAPEADMD